MMIQIKATKLQIFLTVQNLMKYVANALTEPDLSSPVKIVRN